MPRRVKTPELEKIIEKIKSELSVKLKEARENMGFTQNKTSEIIGIDLSHYQNIEHGKALPSVEVLYRMSEVLHFSLDSLVVEDNNSQKAKSVENLLKYCDDEKLSIIEAVANTLLARDK